MTLHRRGEVRSNIEVSFLLLNVCDFLQLFSCGLVKANQHSLYKYGTVSELIKTYGNMSMSKILVKVGENFIPETSATPLCVIMKPIVIYATPKITTTFEDDDAEQNTVKVTDTIQKFL